MRLWKNFYLFLIYREMLYMTNVGDTHSVSPRRERKYALQRLEIKCENQAWPKFA